MTLIADHPPDAEDRLEAENWEGDLVTGAGNRFAIATLVERRTRHLILLCVFTGKPTAETVGKRDVAALLALPEQLRRTPTWDQGKELASYWQITERTSARVFFCDARSPWQRGSKENTNGLLRDSFPKGSDLGGIRPGEPRWIADEINARPRKSLGRATPTDLMAAETELATA